MRPDPDPCCAPPALSHRPAAAGDVLTLAFATTVLMWAAGYVGRLPLVEASPAAVGVALLCVLALGGLATGFFTRVSFKGALATGFVIALLNLLILGSLIHNEIDAGAEPKALLWLPGTLIGIPLLVATLAMIGRRFARKPGPVGPALNGAIPQSEIRNPKSPNWTGRFALVAVAAIVLLLVAGGLVTGNDAGLAVPDWPRSFGYNMFFLPLSRMTGSIYYEHAHRLYGALVGLTTITLAVHVWRVDRRRAVRWLVVIAVLAVMAQGALGGYRVALAKSAATTTGVAIALPKDETSISTVLRVVHGVFAQLFFAYMAVIATVLCTAWKRAKPTPHPAAVTDRQVGIAFVAMLVVQLVLGALLRHLHAEAQLHMMGACGVAILALAAGMRAWGLHGSEQPRLKHLGQTVLGLVGLQIILGITAYVVVGLGDPDWPTPTQAFITTLHQVNGAVLLAVATSLMLMNYRLLTPAPEPVEDTTGIPGFISAPTRRGEIGAESFNSDNLT